MNVIDAVASVIVVLAAIYLIGLAATAFVAPVYAARFLNGFAGSARAHVTEMVIRLTFGCSLLVHAPHMLYQGAFEVFGWLLVISSAILLLLPWRWHQRFAQRVVPPITRRVWLVGIVALPLGGVILFAVVRGGPA